MPMRNGYILLHRKGITEQEWKHPLRTLAWIDLCTMAAWDKRETENGETLKRGEIIASVSFLARRWRQNRGTIMRWLRYWESQQQVQRVTQQPSQQVAQRLFLLNYAKYQDTPQQVPQRVSQQGPQQQPQPIERKNKNQDKKPHPSDVPREGEIEVLDPLEDEYRKFLPIVSRILQHEKLFTIAGLTKWRARRKRFEAHEIGEAFLNLQREADLWKIKNNGWRPMQWWLKSDEYIGELQTCHLKQTNQSGVIIS